MSEEKIVSKTNLHTEVNAEVVETRTDPKQSNSVTIDTKKRKVSKGENSQNVLIAEEHLEKSAQKSSVGLKELPTDQGQDNSSKPIHDLERFQDEASAEKHTFGSTSINEMNYDAEMEYNEYSEEDSYYIKVKDIVDLSDPNTVRLQTDTHVLQLSKLPIVPPFLPENSQDKLFDIGSLSDISDSLKSISYESIKSAKRDTTDFFENLGEVPNVADISLSAEAIEEEKSKVRKIEKGNGRFVNPLTGSVLSFHDESQNDVPEQHDEFLEEEEEAEEEEADDFSFEDFDAIHLENERLYIPEQNKKEEEEQDMLDILITQNQKVGKMEFRIVASEEEKPEIPPDLPAVHVNKFLEELIKQVVQLVEHEESTSILRRNLDKKKLFHQIENCVSDFYVENLCHKFLERKAMEYFRRKRLIRYIIPEKQDIRAQVYEKYKEACDELDKLIGEEALIHEKTSTQIAYLEMTKEEFESDGFIEVQRFQNLVRTTLRREGMPRLEEVVQKELQKIYDLGAEITKVRLGVINQQHILATIKTQIQDLEYIGGGLRIADYESIQQQAITIEKKIEDRTRELNKLHDRFNFSFHILPHLSLKNELYSKRVANQTKTYYILNSKQEFWRKLVFELKKDRQKIKRQISDLSYENGLIDKPTLLNDYDKTYELIEKRRKVIEDLRQTHKKLESRFNQLEKKVYS